MVYRINRLFLILFLGLIQHCTVTQDVNKSLFVLEPQAPVTWTDREHTKGRTPVSKEPYTVYLRCWYAKGEMSSVWDYTLRGTQ